MSIVRMRFDHLVMPLTQLFIDGELRPRVLVNEQLVASYGTGLCTGLAGSSGQ
jgi:hypothetical protein